MITPDEKARIHAALEKTGGDYGAAAEIIGIERGQLSAIIHNNKDLKLRWTTPREFTTPPSDAVTISRPVIPTAAPAPALPSDEEIARAIEREDALVRKGMEAIGVTGPKLDTALALQKFHQKHFQRAIELLGGGITKQFIDLMSEVESINKELAGVLTPQRELLLREDRSRLLDLMNKFYDRANQAVLTQAKVEVLKKQAKEGAGGGKKTGKPGFAPLVAVKAEGNVTITETKPE
jgi:transposase-like protein